MGGWSNLPSLFFLDCCRRYVSLTRGLASYQNFALFDVWIRVEFLDLPVLTYIRLIKKAIMVLVPIVLMLVFSVFTSMYLIEHKLGSVLY